MTHFDSPSAPTTFPDLAQAELLGQAATHLLRGEVIGFPTETVWGLGTLPQHAAQLSQRKGRDAQKALQVSCPSREAALALAIPNPRLEALATLWPGPLTLVAPASALCPPPLAAQGWVGLRVPALPRLLKLLELCGPLATTSLNPAGAPPALTLEQAAAYALADFLLPLSPTDTTQVTGQASTVVRVPAEPTQPLELLREGGLPFGELLSWLEEKGL